VPAAKATVTVVDIRFVLINWGAAMCHVIIYCVLQIKCQNAVEYLMQVCLKFAASTREIGVEVAEFCYISYTVLVLGATNHPSVDQDMIALWSTGKIRTLQERGRA